MNAEICKKDLSKRILFEFLMIISLKNVNLVQELRKRMLFVEASWLTVGFLMLSGKF